MTFFQKCFVIQLDFLFLIKCIFEDLQNNDSYPRKKCLVPPRMPTAEVKNHLCTASIWVAERKLKFLTEHQGTAYHRA